MRPFDACLLDYGNTIVEFDRTQIDFVRQRLTETLSRRVDPVSLEKVTEALETVCTLPFLGDPPQYRELLPLEQMERLLRDIYGGEREFPSVLVHELNDALQEHFVRAITIDSRIPGFLERLREQIPVGCVSNYPCGISLRRSLRETGLDRLLDPIIVSGELGFVKPHGSLFARALEQLDVPAERVLFVGDRWDADMLGGRNAGMKTCHHVGFTSDTDLEARYSLYRPDFQIRGLEELEAILLGVNGEPRSGVASLPPRS